MQTIEDTLLHYSQQYKLFPPYIPVLIAVSGGVDSLCLLHYLYHHRQYLNLQLHVATFDHQLRDQSAQDAEFVADYARELGIPVTIGRTSDFQSQPITNENSARQLRYRFLAHTAQAIGATTVTTAHHADDQTETILHRILRGTSLRGLRAMQPVAPLPYEPSLRLVRPLLIVTRQQILNYAHQHALQPRHDATNDDPSYTRNHLRHNIIPQLEQINPALRQSLHRLAEQATLEDDFINTYLNQHILPQLKIIHERIYMPLTPFLGWHRALQQRVIVWAFHRLQTDAHHEITHAQIDLALTTITTGQVGNVIHLADDLRLRRDYESLVLEPLNAPLPDERPITYHNSESLPLTLDQWHTFPTWRIRLTHSPSTAPHITFYAPPDSHFALRTRRTGDRFQPPHLNGHHQKLKDWLINQKIPAHWRDSIPLLTLNNQIVMLLLETHQPISWLHAHPQKDWQAYHLCLQIISE